jgi:HAD superfamily hydrolase (TIGR01509 family)
MKNMKLFIWDFDGTLVDSYPYSVSCMQQAIRDTGHDATYEQIMEQMLDTIPAALRYFSEKFQIPDLTDRFRQYYQVGADEPVKLFEGVLPVLRRVEQLGGVNLIFTNRNETIFPMLEEAGIADRFAEVVTTVHPHFAWKPAPDAIEYLMKAYGGTVENTVMIGDRICDLSSGWNAGCKTCHLLTPAVPQYPPCDWRIENYQQMLEMLQ